MNRGLLLTLGVLSLFCGPASAQSLRDPVEAEIAFWTAEITRHEPATHDDAATALSTWPWSRLRVVLARLFDRRTLDTTLLLKATVIYGDIALFIPREKRPVYQELFTARERVTLAKDGRPVGETWPDSHLALAHELVRRVVHSRDATDADRALAADWYVAVAAILARAHDLAGLRDHLDEARAQFPRHAEVRFLSGCLAEAIASPSVQAAVALRDPEPRASRMTIMDQVRQNQLARRPNLDQAAGWYREALELEPAHDEARVRLAYVLMLVGRVHEAVPLLEKLPASVDPTLRYYHLLFQARVYESTKRHLDAEGSYKAAAQLYPSAQAPWLGLSALAAARGDFDAARAALGRIAPADEASSDPWWIYDECSGRNAKDIYTAFGVRARRSSNGGSTEIPR